MMLGVWWLGANIRVLGLAGGFDSSMRERIKHFALHVNTQARRVPYKQTTYDMLGVPLYRVVPKEESHLVL